MTMAKEKVAGIDRPYTWYEFASKIEDYCKEQNIVMIHELDYFNAFPGMGKENVYEDQLYTLESTTVFGGSEGIYSDFYIWAKGKRTEVMIAKTLDEGNSNYIKMHEFAARVCVFVFDYLEQHKDEFQWSGYNVGYVKDGNRCYWSCGSYESAMEHVVEMQKTGNKVYIRNNETREYKEV